MPEAERRLIHELITRYQLEPSLQDIYVEGSDDKAIIEGVMEEHGITGVKVLEISCVEVPIGRGEDTGSRAKVVELAKALSQAFQGEELHVACVIDADLDHVFGATENNALLIRTDYTDIEMYFFTSEVFDKLNQQCIRGRKLSAYMVNGFMVSTLTSLFLIRCGNAKLEWHLEPHDFDTLISFDRNQGRFTFDKAEYVKRYLNKNRRFPKREEFLRQVEAIELPEELDRRCFIHGKDFVSLLRIMLNELRGKKVYPSEENVFTLLRACANYASLAEEPMFAKILGRFGH